MFRNFLDSRLFHGINKVVDWLVLSFLFVLTCFPIITVGTSIAALYYTLHKVIFTERSYLFQEYFHAFKDNFKKGTICTLLLYVLGFLFYWDYSICSQYEQGINFMSYMTAVFIVLGIALGVWAIFLFTLMARFELPLKVLLRNSALIGFSRFSSTIGIVLVYLLLFVFPIYLQTVPGELPDGTVVEAAGALTAVPFLSFMVPVYLTIMHKPLENIFRGVMSEEERQNEIEMEQLTKGSKGR